MSNELNNIDLSALACELKKSYEKIEEWKDRRFKRMGAAMAKPLDPKFFGQLYQDLRDKK